MNKPEGDRRQATAVALRGLSKSFNDVTAVQPVNLEIGDGEFFSILGPSGCGKTTLMRMISGFEQPTTGSIELAGDNVTHVPTRSRDLNMLFQSYALFPHLTVRKNVSFELEVRRYPRRDIERMVDQALNLVKLGHLAERKPDQLSGGQRQRVALARAVVSHPKLVLLDEPLGALDQQLRKEMQLELKRMQREVGITFVYVTHDQDEALTMSDRIAVMDHGVIQQVGTPTEIYDRPSTRFVASFIGDCNLFDCQILEQERDGYCQVEIAGIGTVRGVLAEPAGAPRSGTALLRPERLSLSPTVNELPGANSRAATIKSAVFHGDRWRFIVDVNGVDISVSASSAEVDGAVERYAPGSPATVYWNSSDLGIVIR